MLEKTALTSTLSPRERESWNDSRKEKTII
jgi:hypothetical protein